VFDLPAVIGVRVVDGQTLSTLGSGTCNDNVIPGFGDIDRCQSEVGTRDQATAQRIGPSSADAGGGITQAIRASNGKWSYGRLD